MATTVTNAWASAAVLRARCHRILATEGGDVRYFSLAAVGEAYGTPVDRLPICLRVLLESLVRNCDGARATEEDVLRLASWQPVRLRTHEVPFMASRVVLQDVAGIPVLEDFAALRAAAVREGIDPVRVMPELPVTLVVRKGGLLLSMLSPIREAA